MLDLYFYILEANKASRSLSQRNKVQTWYIWFRRGSSGHGSI